MRRSSIIQLLKPVKFLLYALLIITAGCSLEKKSGFNRSMQNLTAHYNILFNAKELLRQKQVSYVGTFIDNYNEILNVYPDTIAQTAAPDKDLEEAIIKANKIISIKEQSNYLGDAYLVMAKAYFLEGNYFNASEYAGYVIRSFPKRADLRQEAMVWQARSLLYLNQPAQAKQVLDTAIAEINPKKSITGDVYATRLQYDINVQDYAEGEEMGKKAVQFYNGTAQKLRLTFILAQIQELNQKNTDAIANYSRIVRSNASFEMAFNASLNRIRAEDVRDGIKTNRTERLMALLKDPNNKEFKDQIYFQVAELQMADKNVDGAIKNYQLSLRNSLKNQNQKGLSYLRLAGINFKNKADYLKAKKYYDSTLTSLPANYPGYQAIQKKANNLQILADRLQIISREDTLQALARMDEKTRATVIDKMVSDRILQQQVDANLSAAATANAAVNETSAQLAQGKGNSSFYFYNTNAVTQGFADFKRKWGNRKLEDNWRRGSRANSDITANTTSTQSIDPDAPVTSELTVIKNNASAGNYRQELLQGLPLTAAKLSRSNIMVYNAYTDIANFYRDVLEDKKEAISYYELILQRFPNDPNKPAIYYNLYRLYSDLDQSKSDRYKNLLLRDYPETPFAKVILDPDYARKLEDVNAEFTQAYNKVFDLYARRQYKEVIAAVPALNRQYPGNKFSAQLYYLKTIAEGHGEKLLPFQDSLKAIIKKYPDDKLVSPLITQHLGFIAANQAELLARPVVLTDDNPQDLPFTRDNALKEETAYRKKVEEVNYASRPENKTPEKPKEQAAVTAKVAPVVTPPVVTQKITPAKKDTLITAAKPAIKDTALVAVTAAVQPPVTQPAVQEAIKQPDALPSIFSMADSTNYYFAVNVSTGTTNLASSRFGFGQFDRANYAGKGIRHQLKVIGADNQIIYVGRFFSLADAKTYARQIIPLLPDIMKVPAAKYSFFIITQENLNKLADRKILDSYTDFYQKNY